MNRDCANVVGVCLELCHFFRRVVIVDADLEII